MPYGPLVAGSLHYDIMVAADHLPRRDETATGRRWYPKFGGKGGNQAVSVCRQGAAARMVGAVGGDEFGRFLRSGLRQAGVDDRFVTTLPGIGSGMSVAIQDAGGDYAAAIVSGSNLRIDPAVIGDDALWQGVALLVLQCEVPDTVNLAAAAGARRCRGPPPGGAHCAERRPQPPRARGPAAADRCAGGECGRGRDDGGRPCRHPAKRRRSRQPPCHPVRSGGGHRRGTRSGCRCWRQCPADPAR